MRFILKTNYNRDIDVFRDRVHFFWYFLLVLVMLIAPLFAGTYFQSQLTLLFIYAIAGAGLMVLVGYTGLVSLGHAAFLLLGAYVHTLLLQYDIPFVISLPVAAIACGVFGMIVGLAALRATGVYLAIATLAFAMIVEQVIKNWKSLTGGNNGLKVLDPTIFGFDLQSNVRVFGLDSEVSIFYYVCFVILVLVLVLIVNLLRAPTGRSFIAVRDSEISAQAMGVNLTATKIRSFSLSAALTGIAGGLMAHQIGHLFPDSFTIVDSIKLLMLVVVGGLGSVHGVIFGAIFLILLPEAISVLKGWLPQAMVYRGGLEPLIFGGILILFLVFEPLGIYGRWQKILLYFNQFPLYRKKTFKRQRSFLRTERVH